MCIPAYNKRAHNGVKFYELNGIENIKLKKTKLSQITDANIVFLFVIKRDLLCEIHDLLVYCVCCFLGRG